MFIYIFLKPFKHIFILIVYEFNIINKSIYCGGI